MSEFAGARARNTQDFWVYLDEYRPGSKAAVAARLDPKTREYLEFAARTAWIPIEHDARFVDAVIEEFGPESKDVWRRYTARFLDGGLIKALVEGTIRIFGLSLYSLVKNAPRGWQQSYRGCGLMEVHRQGSADALVLEINELHPVMVERDGYFVLLHGIFHGLHDVVKVEDNMDFAVDRDGRQLTAVFRW